jgi:hypothetical protein
MNGLQRRDFLTDTAAPAAAAALPGSARAALGPNEKFDLLLRKDWLQWTGVFESGGVLSQMPARSPTCTCIWQHEGDSLEAQLGVDGRQGLRHDAPGRSTLSHGLRGPLCPAQTDSENAAERRRGPVGRRPPRLIDLVELGNWAA